MQLLVPDPVSDQDVSILVALLLYYLGRKVIRSTEHASLTVMWSECTFRVLLFEIAAAGPAIATSLL